MKKTTWLPVLAAVALSLSAAKPGLAKCRDAYASSAGAWGSARICYTPAGKGWYKASLKGTIKDTKADKRRATLFVGYSLKTPKWFTAGRGFQPVVDRVQTAEHKGKTRYGSWTSRRGQVRNVTIHVCTTDRWGGRYNCSKAH
jgi:hypothetical protein